MTRLIVGDVREELAQLEDGSVHCCVTSPPYFGLRDYGMEGQIGLEQTPDDYVAEMVAVFREVRRVLRDDGTLWLNLGDTYATKKFDDQFGKSCDLKPKDLMGIPWRVAFALQSDGWYLRQDVIWHKTNPTPEGARDRPSKAHEYIFLLSKSSCYHYDQVAAKEPIQSTRAPSRKAKKSGVGHAALRGAGSPYAGTEETRNRRSVWTVSTKPFKEAHFAVYPPDLIEPCILAGCPEGGIVLDPFFGAGTTGLVAQKFGRDWIGVELNPDYAEIARRRLGMNDFHLAYLWAVAV